MGHWRHKITKEVIDGIIDRSRNGEKLLDVIQDMGMSENTYYRFFNEFYPQPPITVDMALDILHEMLKSNLTFTAVIRGRGLRMSVAKKAFEEFGLPISFRKSSGKGSSGDQTSSSDVDYKPGRYVKCGNCALRSECEDQGDASTCKRYKADIAQRHREIRLIEQERLRLKRNGIKKK